MNEGIHLDLDTWIVPGQIRKANICRQCIYVGIYVHTYMRTWVRGSEVHGVGMTAVSRIEVC